MNLVKKPKRKNNPITSLDRPWGFQEVEAHRFQDIRHMKVVSLSALRTDHDQQRSNRFSPTVKPEAPSAVVSSWWWAGRCPKHVEPHI